MEYKSNYFKEREVILKVDLTSELAPFPKNALIELSNACNHFCVFCNNPRMKRKINTLDKGTYLKIHRTIISKRFKRSWSIRNR